MLEEDIKRLLNERRWLFRGTSEAAYYQNGGFYYATRRGEEVRTSGTLSLLYAMIYAKLEGRKRESLPILLAIDARPYIDLMEKGIEWKPFRMWDGIILHDEYVIGVPIRVRHVHRIETLGALRHYAAYTPRKSFERLKKKFAELTSMQQGQSAG